MDKTNKQVIEELKRYFLQQDHDSIATALAGAMLDIHRFINIEQLDDSEAESLINRSKQLSNELVSFCENGPRGPLKAHVTNSEESC